jgi:uncharacterized phage-associated protein
MNFEKLIQMANYILAKYEYKLNYTKLIKILYLADREALDKYDFAISGDDYASMPQGPVLSRLYDFIKGKDNSCFQSEWNKHFYTDNYDLISRVKSECNYGELSEAEENILDEIDSKYHNKDWQYLVDKVVHNLKEWDSNSNLYNTSYPLDKKTILKALGKSDETIAEIIRTQEACETGHKLLNGN